MKVDPHRQRTLWLCTVLHAFAHGYQVALIPLYLLITKDLKLQGEDGATLLVATIGVASFLPSYPMGILADRWSRKNLLAIGLFINAIAFVGLSFVRSLPQAMGLVLLAGFGISFFHPSATALIARLFPEARGKALGRMGIGAGAGFFVAPIYTGWRAMDAGWRTPVLELGLMGLVGAALFFWLAHDHANTSSQSEQEPPRTRLFSSTGSWLLFLGLCVAFSFRDFAGSGIATLGSLFLQQAHGFNPKDTGLALSTMFLAAVISNPFFGGLSDRGRIRWVVFVLSISAVLILAFPRLAPQWIVPGFVAYGFFFMASFPMVEAGLMDSIHDSIRGRVFGVFITVCGCFGNAAHWVVGHWVEGLGAEASRPRGYQTIYTVLGAFILISITGLLFLHRLKRSERVEHGLEKSEGALVPNTNS